MDSNDIDTGSDDHNQHTDGDASIGYNNKINENKTSGGNSGNKKS